MMNMNPKEIFEAIESLFEEDLEQEVCKMSNLITLPMKKLTKIELDLLGQYFKKSFLWSRITQKYYFILKFLLTYLTIFLRISFYTFYI